MEVFEVVPGLSIGTRLAETADYDSLGVEVVIDLEDWDWAWVPPVPLGKVFVSFPMEDEDNVDPKVRDVAAFVASLVGSGRRVLVHCTEGLNRSGVVIARAEIAQAKPRANGTRVLPPRPPSRRSSRDGSRRPSGPRR
jgi:Dual specificity phosphatase, catalytic domain